VALRPRLWPGLPLPMGRSNLNCKYRVVSDVSSDCLDGAPLGSVALQQVDAALIVSQIERSQGSWRLDVKSCGGAMFKSAPL